MCSLFCASSLLVATSCQLADAFALECIGKTSRHFKVKGYQFKAIRHHIGYVEIEKLIPEMLDVYVAMMEGATLSGKPIQRVVRELDAR